MFTGGKGDNGKGGSREQQTAVEIKKIKYSVLELKWQRKAKHYYLEGHIILTCSLFPLCTRGLTPQAAGQR